MKQFRIVFCVLAATLIMTGTAGASIGGFLAISNSFGYTGTVQDVSGSGAGSPVAVPTPRDVYLYDANNVPPSVVSLPNSNINQTNYSQSGPSNQTAGFFQINELGSIPSITSASAVWTDESGNPSLWDFTLTITGSNATWASSSSRLWRPNQPDVAAPGGTFSTYTYTLTAIGMTTAIDPTSLWRYSTDQPGSISGGFTGSFIATNTPVSSGSTPITGSDQYNANLTFSSLSFSSSNFSGSPSSVFAAPQTAVPEPATIIVWSLLGLSWAVGLRVWRCRKVA